MSHRGGSLTVVGTLATLGVAVLGLSACTALGGTSDPTAEDIAEFADVPRDLTSYVGQEFAWGTCDPAWLSAEGQGSDVLDQSLIECGSVLVPATYRGVQNIPDFSIAVMRVTRLEDKSEPTTAIFINPGGPGGSGIEQVQYSEFPEALHLEIPFVGFDPRGVGFSDFADGSEIKCSDVLDYTSYFGEGSPANEAELDGLVAQSDLYYEDCTANNPYWWTLSTNNVARDLEIMRQVITPGEQLNFIGSSYGTTIAGRYVSLFPEGVGKIVFDSPTTVDDDRIASALIGVEADEVKLRGFVEGYALYAGITFDEAWDRVLTVRQRADDDLLVGYAGFEPSPVEPTAMISSEALFTRGIRTLNYLPPGQAQEWFNAGMDEAYLNNWNGDFEWLGFSLDGYDPSSLAGPSLEAKNIVRSNEYEIRVIVNTMDYALASLTEEEQRELSTKAREVAPLLSALGSDASGYEYFGPPRGLDWESYATADPLIPDPPSTPFVPSNPSGKKLLIVGSINESVTPYSFAKDTAALLGAPLVSVESSEHAPAAGYNNECINSVLLAYFLGSADVVDVTCSGT
jgi:pimeloyl-ACP methyl ester carboxylesterase